MKPVKNAMIIYVLRIIVCILKAIFFPHKLHFFSKHNAEIVLFSVCSNSSDSIVAVLRYAFPTFRHYSEWRQPSILLMMCMLKCFYCLRTVVRLVYAFKLFEKLS